MNVEELCIICLNLNLMKTLIYLQVYKNNKLRIQGIEIKENFIKSTEYADLKGTLYSRQHM